MKVAVISSHTKSLIWFRMDMMNYFVSLGIKVVAASDGTVAEWESLCENRLIKYCQITVSRNGLNPFADLRTYKSLVSFLSAEKPDKIFIYQAKTISYGCIAAQKCNISDVYVLMGGLGSVYRGVGLKNAIVRGVMSMLYKAAFENCRKVIFQNRDDSGVFLRRKLVKPEKVEHINGSGVNLEEFVPTNLPSVPAFLFLGRIIADKGVMEYLEAAKRIKKLCPSVRFMIAGAFDTNPTSLGNKDIEPYVKDGIVELLGFQDDVRKCIADATALVLPSYHEGTPKTVLEAMAMGRPIVTSDAPGCRETVINGHNGFLVPVRDVDGLVEGMLKIISNREMAERMAEKSLKMVREKYDVKLVNKEIARIMDL